MVPVVANLTLFKVALAATNPFASVVELTVAVPSVIVFEELVELLLPQLVPTAITITITIPRKTALRHLFVANSRATMHASAAQTSLTRSQLGSGQLRRSGLKTEPVVVAEKVTIPVGAAPVLPAAGFEEVCVSTKTVSEKAVFAATLEGLVVMAAVVEALVTLRTVTLELLGSKLLSPT